MAEEKKLSGPDFAEGVSLSELTDREMVQGHASGEAILVARCGDTHFAVGASKALVTTRPWWATGLEMTFVGILEAAVTYGLGVAFANH